MAPRRQIAAKWEPLDALVPWAENPRDNAGNVGRVAASIERFGFGAPIIANKRDKQIIAGHTRLLAAKRLGLDKVPVRWLDLEPDEAHALALADNRLTELSPWDDDALEAVLAELRENAPDLVPLTGFGDDALEALLEPEPVAEDSPEDDDWSADVEAVTQPGDEIDLGAHRLVCGDCVAEMAKMPDASVDAIVTDPPYGLGFMGKEWDALPPGPAWAEQCLRVLRPGGHVVAFGGTRTVHRLAVALEDAGFEIRDTIHWCYWSGFPKSLDVSKAIDKAAGAEREVVGRQKLTGTARRGVDGSSHGAARTNAADKKERQPTTIDITTPATPDAEKWNGWGTALKPALEPAILARKPMPGTVVDCVQEHGTGALNIDACRIPPGDKAWPGPGEAWGGTYSQPKSPSTPGGDADRRIVEVEGHPSGRWPANLYHCAKPATSEREAGTEGLERDPTEVTGRKAGSAGQDNPRAGMRGSRPRGNSHPTVKPVNLMRWLVRLVTPPGGTVLEPFAGSGTTLVACEREGVACTGFEVSPEYCDIIRARVQHAIACEPMPDALAQNSD